MQFRSAYISVPDLPRSSFVAINLLQVLTFHCGVKSEQSFLEILVVQGGSKF